MRKLVATLAVALLFTVSAPATSEAALNDSRIYNTGSYGFLACKDWGNTICQSASVKT